MAAVNPLIVYAVTLFISALLLFLVQPMIGKQILPKFGGAPAVWSACMLFYQAVLLAGYFYAHYVTKKLPPRKQILTHFVLLLLPLVTFAIFPVGFAFRWLNPPGDQSAALWVLLILALLIGVPFFVVSTSAPLFQRWFAHTGHEAAQDPYFLYAASNLGSFASLLLYPLVIEMYLGRPAQGVLWMVGYGLLIGLAFWSGWIVLRKLPAETGENREARQTAPAESEAREAAAEAGPALADAPVEADAEADEEAITDKPQVVVKTKKLRAKDRAKAASLEAVSERPVAKEPPGPRDRFRPSPAPGPLPVLEGPSPGQYLRWILLGFVPSSMMLGVTMYTTTDIAAVPMLWLFPLALYLLTFVIVFSKTPERLFGRLIASGFGAGTAQWLTYHWLITLLLPVLVLIMVFATISGREFLEGLFGRFAVHYGAFFMVAMFCHGELARTRPAPQFLTGFYLAMSVGGVLGGIFNALIAPVLFNTVAEYSLVLVVACFLVPPLFEESRSQFNRIVDIFLAAVLGGTGCYVLVVYLSKALGLDWGFLGIEANAKLLPPISGLPGIQIQVAGYVLVLAAAVILFAYAARGPSDQKLERALDLALPPALCLLALLIFSKDPFSEWFRGWESWGPFLRRLCTYGIPVALCYGFAERPVRFGLGVGAILLASALMPEREDYGRYVEETVYRERSFFGVLKIEHQRGRYVEGDRLVLKTDYHKLLHGTTLHGMQRVRWEPGEDVFASVAVPLAFGIPWGVAAGFSHVAEQVTDPRQEPLTYYHRTGPIGQVYKALISGQDATAPVAFVGLGTGTMASYCNPGQTVTFYEIDEAVVRIAENPDNFSYLKSCRDRGGKIEWRMGDARLKLEEAPDKKYKLIVVDAFSSDAIPLHLTTREAIELYLRKLRDDGVVAMHISNRHLELEPVLANIAADLGVAAIEQYDNTVTAATPGKNASDWVMIARKMENFGPLQKEVWRWPQDQDRRWKDLVNKGDASRLSSQDVDDWRRQDIAIREKGHRSQVEDSFRADDEEFRKNVMQRIQKLDHVPSTDEETSIRREEAEKLIKARAEKKVAEYRDKMMARTQEDLRAAIQKEIDQLWARDMDWRNDVGVWTDDYSNILKIWREWRAFWRKGQE